MDTDGRNFVGTTLIHMIILCIQKEPLTVSYLGWLPFNIDSGGILAVGMQLVMGIIIHASICFIIFILVMCVIAFCVSRKVTCTKVLLIGATMYLVMDIYLVFMFVVWSESLPWSKPPWLTPEHYHLFWKSSIVMCVTTCFSIVTDIILWVSLFRAYRIAQLTPHALRLDTKTD